MNGCTPLHFTALSNHCDMAKLLLHAKADAKIKDYRGETAMDYAAHLVCCCSVVEFLFIWFLCVCCFAALAFRPLLYNFLLITSR